MTKNLRRATALLPIAAVLLLAACAADPSTPGGDGDPGDSTGIHVDQPIAAPGEVVGQGTVLQVGDAAPQFCLGAVAESYPPQCSGSELIGWDWDAIEGHETASDVTWGTYAVWGTWDGTSLTVTDSVMLALYDPMPVEDPLVDPANAGETDEAELVRIQTELHESAPFAVLTSWPENGYLFAQVVYDDGSIQAWVDQKYLPDVVAIRSALVDVE